MYMNSYFNGTCMKQYYIVLLDRVIQSGYLCGDL